MAFTSTAGWGDMVAGDAVGGTVVGIELLDAVTGATEAGLAAEEGAWTSG